MAAKRNQRPFTVINLPTAVHAKLKAHCQKHGLKMGAWLAISVQRELMKDTPAPRPSLFRDVIIGDSEGTS